MQNQIAIIRGGVYQSKEQGNMSLQQAKKIAELREQIEIASKQVSALHDGFRAKINESVLERFNSHLGDNDFFVTKTDLGSRAEYKDLVIELKLPKPEDRYIGIYHSFDIVVNGKKNSVRVIVALGGAAGRPIVNSSDTVDILEQDLKRTQDEAANLTMLSFHFDCIQPNAMNKNQTEIKHTIPEVLDYYLA